jgi:hypothetical protein
VLDLICMELFNIFSVCLNSHWLFILCQVYIYPILCWCWCPNVGTSSIDWAQLSTLLPEDGDGIQSPKHCVLNKKTGQWILSKDSVIEPDTILGAVRSFQTSVGTAACIGLLHNHHVHILLE